MKDLIIITGATGVGKTDLSLQLGQNLPIEIINGDMGQLYEPLTIGTAKPDWKNEVVRHHLFDILKTPESYTVTRYRKAVGELITQIHQRGNTPVIVGGSFFYIKSLFFPPHDIPIQNTTPYTGEITWQKLHAIDPLRAAQINAHDTYRIERALNQWHQTGTLPSLYMPVYTPIHSNCIIIHGFRPRENLYSRIDARVIEMINNGWIEEVRQLPKAWIDFLQAKKIIGYAEIIHYLKTDLHNTENLITEIQQKTRRYAKRQETAWRTFKKEIIVHKSVELLELDLTLSPINLYIDQLLSILMSNANDKKNK